MHREPLDRIQRSESAPLPPFSGSEPSFLPYLGYKRIPFIREEIGRKLGSLIVDTILYKELQVHFNYS